MTPYTADLPITVDLHVISKYHSATRIKADNYIKRNISTNNYADKLKVFLIKNEDELHPAFDYWKYAEDAGLEELTANNLLYLIYVNCLYEWRVYYESLVTPDLSRDISLVSGTPNELNLVLDAHKELNTLRDLCLVLESHPEETDISFSYRSVYERRGKETREKYKILGIEINNPAQVQTILRYTIDILFKAAQESFNSVLSEILANKRATYNSIDEAIRSLPVPPQKLDEAISSFRKHLIEGCIEFLRSETNLNPSNDKISITEAMLFYSAFSLFRLISPDLIENHIDNTSRVKYIRSMALNAGNIKEKNPKSEVKDNPTYTFKDVSFKNVD
jgi:hypothetical protein